MLNNYQLKDVILEDQINEEAKNEIDRVNKIDKILNREDLIFETNKHIYDF